MDESLSLPGAMAHSRADTSGRASTASSHEAGTAEKTERDTVAWPAAPGTPPTNCPGSPNYSSSLYNRITLQLLSLCTEVPGLVLYVVWLVAFAGLCAGTQYLAHTCDVTGLRQNKVGVASTSDLSEQDRSRVLFVQALAAAIFGVGTWIQMSALLFQISAKKRQLSSLVAYVNLVSMSTYVATLCGWLPVLYGWNGHPLQMRYVEWVSATPIMLLCLAALGGTMQDGLVQDWPLASKTMFWDVFMVTMGLVQSAVQSEDIGWAACVLGVMAGCYVFYGVNRMSHQSVINSATTHEVVSLRALEYFTYLLWTFFPVIHIAHRAGYIDVFQEEIALAIMDVVAKQIYSVTLLTGNFCIMDVVSTLRLDQIQAERDQKSNAVLRAEIMNKALQTQVVEAETSARLSRLFLANISHELRTPLNSVISFNSLILEDGGLSEVHEEYLQASLTSAEALLGVINQVLEYAKLETQEDDNSLNKVHLESKPFCLRQMSDELCDIVTARVKSRDADFAIENSCLYNDDSSNVVIGDSFRLRQCLINLCDNGIKFSKDEGGQVRLQIRLVRMQFPPQEGQDRDTLSFRHMLQAPSAVAAPGAARGKEGAKAAASVLQDCWQFDVTDNGTGIPLDKQGVLFKPFSQVSSHYARRHGGTGLGLAITKKIVASMGGLVSLHSRGTGQGATFTIVMPTTSLPVVPKSQKGSALESMGSPRPAATSTMKRSKSPDLICRLSGYAMQGTKKNVVLVLNKGPTCEAIQALVKGWGLSVTNYAADASTVQQVRADIEHEHRQAAAFAAAAAASSSALASSSKGKPSTVFVIEAEIAILLAEAKCTALEMVSVLIIGSHKDSKRIKALGQWTRSLWMPRPVKLSAIQRKMHCLYASGRIEEHELISVISDDHEQDNSSKKGDAEEEGVLSREASGISRASADGMLRILVVDDHLVNQKVAVAMVRKILGKDAVEIEIANDGHEALAMVTASKLPASKEASKDALTRVSPARVAAGQNASKEAHTPAPALRFDLIFMDVQMPGMDGLEATRRIREWEARHALSHYIVALTAHANKTDIDDCLEAGMDLYMSKPLNMSSMKSLLHDLRTGQLRDHKGKNKLPSS